MQSFHLAMKRARCDEVIGLRRWIFLAALADVFCGSAASALVGAMGQ